jgi:hypothetical protein
VSTELGNAAAWALQHLPDQLLEAMVRGLRAHAGDLAPGVLFRGNASGGCAVGITLRELAPDAFTFGRLRFWLWQRWRRGVERDVARRYPRLEHLQWHFDAAVAALERALTVRQPAKTAGLWLAASAEAELRARRGGVSEPAPHRRAAHLTDRPTRRREHEPEANRAPLRPEPSRWS